MKIRIHKIKDSEQKDCARLIQAIIREFGLRGRYRIIPTRLGQYYAKDGGVFYSVSADGTIIGCAGVFRLSKTKVDVQRFFLRKDYRAKNIGKRLFKKIKSFCRKNKIKTIILDTLKTNFNAQGFYERQGLKKYKTDRINCYYALKL